MIRGLVSNDCFDDAVEFYSLMRSKGFLPNNFTFPFVLKACARLLDLQLGVKIHTLGLKLVLITMSLLRLVWFVYMQNAVF